MSYHLIPDPAQVPVKDWADFVFAHPDGSVFQSPEMFEFFQAVPKFSPVVLAVKDDGGRIRGIMLAVIIREMKGPSAFFSSRTVIYGGPLTDPATEDRDEILGMLLQGLIAKVKHHSIFIQFRNFFDQKSQQENFESRGFRLRDRLNLLVNTSDQATVIRNMSASRWRQIRKGLGIGRLGDMEMGRSGDSMLDVGNPEPGTRKQKPEIEQSNARIIVPKDISQVREFYEILYRLYRYKVKKPLPPWEFFEQFYLFSRQGKLGVILLVEYQGKIIGGILSPVTAGRTIYEWYVCGMDREYRHVHPSVLATWAAMDYAVSQCIPEFDFMGVGLPDREYGVREFKSRFGGRMVNYGRFARINNRFFYAVAEAGFNVLSLFRKI